MQLFTGRMHYRHEADTGYWRSQVAALPAAAQSFAFACLERTPASMEKLMRHSFFTAGVRAAAVYIARLDHGTSSRCTVAEGQDGPELYSAAEEPAGTEQLSQGQPQMTSTLMSVGNTESRREALAASSNSSIDRDGAGRLQELLDGPLSLKALASQNVLQLCTQSIIRVVTEAAVVARPNLSGADQSAAAAVAETLLRLIVLLPRSLAVQEPLRVWTAFLGGKAPFDLLAGVEDGRVDPSVQAELMQPGRLRQLVEAVGLSAYLDSVHSMLLSLVCGGASDAGEATTGHSTHQAVQVCPAHLFMRNY